MQTGSNVLLRQYDYILLAFTWFEANEESAMVDTRSLTRGTGVASLGLGTLMAAAPGRMSRLFGMGKYRRVVLLLGVRDLIIGTGLVSGRSSRLWLRARAVSDMADAVMLAGGLSTGAFARGQAALGIAVATGSSALSFWLARRSA